MKLQMSNFGVGMPYIIIGEIIMLRDAYFPKRDVRKIVVGVQDKWSGGGGGGGGGAIF